LRLLIQNNFNIDVAFFDMQRLGLTDEEIGGLVINPNSLGVLCVLSVGCLMQIRSAGEKKKLDMFLTVSILILGALTCSRTYLACLLILGVFKFVSSNIGVKGKLKLLLGSGVVLLISASILSLVFPTTVEMFIQRLTAEDITSGRYALFAEYNKYLLSSAKALVWGVGSLNLGEKVVELSISFGVPHNGIQEILVAWGIIGLLLFIAMIGVMIRRSKQENPHQSWANYALLIVLLAKIMVGQVITSNYTMLAFALVYLSLCHDCTTKRLDN
jgi:O-antigen ligase